jgi:hypothetical protein
MYRHKSMVIKGRSLKGSHAVMSFRGCHTMFRGAVFRRRHGNGFTTERIGIGGGLPGSFFISR